jgi:hypothetical protein
MTKTFAFLFGIGFGFTSGALYQKRLAGGTLVIHDIGGFVFRWEPQE